MKKLLFLFVVTFFNITCSKVLIITHVHNQPDFIELQHKAFQKFLQDDYEFVIFNDAQKPDLVAQIDVVCKNLDLRCIRVPQQIHTSQIGSQRHADCIKYSLDHLGFYHNGIVFLVDSDNFLLKPFHIASFMEGFDMGGLNQTRKDINYFWPGLVFMDMRTMPNKETICWNPGKIGDIGVDTGGYTYFYLKNNPGARVHYFSNYNSGHLMCDACEKKENYACNHNTECLQSFGFEQREISFIQKGPPKIEFMLENHFFHMRGVTWMFDKERAFKLGLVRSYLEEVLS